MLKTTIQANKLLIFTLGTLAVLRPLAKITHLIHLFPTDKMGSLLLTLLISLLWFGTVLVKQNHYPIIVLASAGLIYALWAFFLSGILSPILTGSLQGGPLTNLLTLISVVVTNLIWDALVGCLAVPFIRKNHEKKKLCLIGFHLTDITSFSILPMLS
ncbi:MAG TPA: hypothetical protein H9869_05665 [Candidatus Ligilactobacillus excrementipullorum]|nr:hypothetical protein [Candidatus Ligilactobacillus excrementipullorum]